MQRVTTWAVRCIRAVKGPWAVWAVIAIGAVLRIAQFLFNRSLTEGEAPLALNIIERSYTGLLQPLGYVQAAPPGFLWIEKLATALLGSGEMALRLFPLIAGIAALILFRIVAERTLRGIAVPVAVLLFAVGDHLIYFASEVKPYSSDVMICLLVVLSCILLLQKNAQPRYAVVLGAVGAIGFWFSYPSVFVFAAGAVVCMLWILRRGKYRALWWWGCACLVTAASFLVHYSTVLKRTSTSPDLLTFWQHAFAPLPCSLQDIMWYPYVLLRMFKFPLGLWEYGLMLAVLCFAAGCIVLFRQGRAVLGMIFLTLFFTLLASGLRFYPFEGRLLLFLTPLMLLPVASGILYAARIAARASRVFGAVLILALIAYPVANAGYRIVQPRAPEELRPALEYIINQYQDGDAVYVYYGARNAFQYYRDRVGYKGEYIMGTGSRDDWSGYFEELQTLRGRRRVWFLFSHIATDFGTDEERLFVSYLDTMGERIDAKQGSGAAAYLYDLGF